MAYSLAMTEIFRNYRYVESEFSLFNRVVRDFGDASGPERLAYALGVSLQQAASILRAYDDRAFCRVGYHYGLMPNEDSDTGWRVLPMFEEPVNPGPPLRWTPRLVMYLQELFSYPSYQPSVDRLAWRMDTTSRRLRDGMRKYGVPVPSKEYDGTWIDTRSKETWSDLMASYAVAKPTGAKRLRPAAALASHA